MTEDQDTLILVTADHAHVMSIAGTGSLFTYRETQVRILV